MSDKQPNFTEMFAKLGRDLNLPKVDLEALMDHHRKNLEALEKSAKAAAGGASEMMARQREIMADSLREITDLAQGLRSPCSPQDMVANQAELAKRSFETALKNAGDMAEIFKKSGTDTFKILQDRMQESMDEIRKSFDKKS